MGAHSLNHWTTREVPQWELEAKVGPSLPGIGETGVRDPLAISQAEYEKRALKGVLIDKIEYEKSQGCEY